MADEAPRPGGRPGAADAERIRRAAAAIANARAGRRGAPPVENVLDILPERLLAEVMEDARAALAAGCTAEAEARALPRDVLSALVGWWRAYHFGTWGERREAEDALCDAIGPRLEAMRSVLHAGVGDA